MKPRYSIFLLLLTSTFLSAQVPHFVLPDSLARKDCQYLRQAVSRNWNDSIAPFVYAEAWLEKARRAGDARQMAMAYKVLIHKGTKALRLPFADSMVSAAEKTFDKQLVGSAYLTRGAVYYDRMEHMKALENYLAANTLISQTNDRDQIYKVKYQIAQAKYLLGYYDEAIGLFQDCTIYFQTENDRAYLNSLHGLSLCYNSIGKYSFCSQTTKLGIDMGRKTGNYAMEPYFVHSEGVNQYSLGHFNEAIVMLNKALPTMRKNNDLANETVAYFYLARSYWSLKRYETALPYLKKVDNAFVNQNYMRPDLRANYELLIDYYKNKGDHTSEITYLNRLQKIDLILISNYRYLAPKITREYDTKRIENEKADAQLALKVQSIRDFSVITIMSGTILFLVYRHNRNKRRYRKSYEALMARDLAKPEPVAPPKESELDISKDVAETILKNLVKFEQNKKYLEKDLNLFRMSALLNTNTKYVSKVIFHFRGKKTIEYISDLKIDYIRLKLKDDSRFRNYTNKALGEEAGFGSTQNFTKAFKARTGIAPSYFVQQLKKELEI